jgi:tetratricopeptide (TPR) repeat protein
VWQNLLLELKARPGGDPAKTSPMFASHPPAEERNALLTQLAEATPGGVANEETWQERIRPFRHDWLLDEVKRGQFDESLALLTRMVNRTPSQPELLYARAEVYRLRAKDGDLDTAIGEYLAAAAAGGEPPETHRGLGMIYRLRHQLPEARSSFARYLELAPHAPDFPMIKSYVEELGT